MLYLSLLRTKTNKIVREHDTFNEAWNFLNDMANSSGNNVVEGLVLLEEDYLDNQMPDFDSCKVIASMRIVR